MELILPLLSDPRWLAVVALSFLLLLVIIVSVVNIRWRKSLEQQRSEASSLLQEQASDFQQQLTALKEEKLIIEAHLQSRNEHMIKMEEGIQQRTVKIEEIQAEVSQQRENNASLRTELSQQRDRSEEKIKTLEEARHQLSQEFESLANKIFDEKTQRFNKNSQVTLDNAISPLREQLKDFKQKVEDVYEKDSKDRHSLSAELNQLKQLNQQMSADALNLTNALKGDNKAQGNWGEVVLERVLEESGLHKGREYETQVSLKSEQGKNQQPDVIVRLPENKDLIIDSKVSLVHYERFCNSDDDTERQVAIKDHIASVRSHIRDLSVKNYEGLEGLRTLDFVLIFIPIESAFMAAFEHDQSMFRDAYEKNIIVVGPTTLLATLRTIQSIWRYERQNKNAEEIARQAGAMHDKFVGFVNDLEDIDKYIGKAAQAHESALNKLSKGKGNLVSSTLRLEKLGAKVKKTIPASALGDDQLSALDQHETGKLTVIDSGSNSEK